MIDAATVHAWTRTRTLVGEVEGLVNSIQDFARHSGGSLGAFSSSSGPVTGTPPRAQLELEHPGRAGSAGSSPEAGPGPREEWRSLSRSLGGVSTDSEASHSVSRDEGRSLRGPGGGGRSSEEPVHLTGAGAGAGAGGAEGDSEGEGAGVQVGARSQGPLPVALAARVPVDAGRSPRRGGRESTSPSHVQADSEAIGHVPSRRQRVQGGGAGRSAVMEGIGRGECPAVAAQQNQIHPETKHKKPSSCTQELASSVPCAPGMRMLVFDYIANDALLQAAAATVAQHDPDDP
eukprot:3940927-Rhodomonas_salina.5